MKTRLFQAALTAAAATLLLPVAASADTLTIEDSRSDSWQELWDETSERYTYVEAGSQPNADITKVVVRHSAGKVLLRTKYTDLVKRRDEMVMNLARIRTDESGQKMAFVMRFPGGGKQAAIFKRSGDKVKCPDMVSTIDWDGDLVELSIPRSCLSDPKWVSVNVAAGSITMDETAEQELSYVDVAGQDGHAFNQGWSARVRRG